MSVVERANQFVRDTEIDYAKELLDDYKQAQQAGEKCGCPQCTKRVVSLENRVLDESDRLRQVPEMDSDELALMNYALLRLNERNQE